MAVDGTACTLAARAVQVVFASGLVLGEGTASIINAVGKALF